MCDCGDENLCFLSRGCVAGPKTVCFHIHNMFFVRKVCVFSQSGLGCAPQRRSKLDRPKSAISIGEKRPAGPGRVGPGRAGPGRVES